MQIVPNQKALLLRYNNYRKNSFISEHQAILNQNGKVWILKAGKMIPSAKLQDILTESRILLLRAPKSEGGQYFCCKMTASFNGNPTPEMEFPDYYYDMIDDDNLWSLTSLQGTWFCIDEMVQLPNEIIPHIYLCSNKKIAEDVVSTTRSSVMYVASDTLCSI